jgi:hypothetical protein
MKREYEAPAIKVLGSLKDLTQRIKVENQITDGDVFQGKSLGS